MIMNNLLIPVGKFFSAFEPSFVIKEQRARVKRPGSNWGGSVPCSRTLRHAAMGRAGIEPGTFTLTFTPTANLEPPMHLSCMSLYCGSSKKLIIHYGKK